MGVIAWSLINLDTKQLKSYFRLSAYDAISTSLGL